MGIERIAVIQVSLDFARFSYYQIDSKMPTPEKLFDAPAYFAIRLFAILDDEEIQIALLGRFIARIGAKQDNPLWGNLSYNLLNNIGDEFWRDPACL